MSPSDAASPAAVRDGSGGMFDRIAGRYDLLNRIMSLGQDHVWRRRLVRSLDLPEAGGCEVLDVATGTADVALAIAAARPEARLVGLDPSEGMLEQGRVKVAEAQLSERIELIVGDAQEMPFEDGRFDASCISFGIRNVPDRSRGLAEMRRVTKPGGRVCILELSEPRRGLMAPFARFHIHHVVPRLGAWLSGDHEYRYLQQSIEAFPQPEAFVAMMEEVGLREVEFQAMNFASVVLFMGRA